MEEFSFKLLEKESVGWMGGEVKRYFMWKGDYLENGIKWE